MFYDEFIKLCNSVSKSPTAVAKEMGFTGAHVNKWKNGSTPTDATIFKICDYFSLPHDYFSTCEKEKAPTKEGEREVDTLSPAFFRLKKGLEPYNISESDADFILTVYKAHIDKNNQEKS